MVFLRVFYMVTSFNEASEDIVFFPPVVSVPLLSGFRSRGSVRIGLPEADAGDILRASETN